MHGFWPAEELAELADGPIGSAEVARGGCLFAWNFSVSRSTVITEAERIRPIKMLSLYYWLVPSVPFENFTGHHILMDQPLSQTKKKIRQKDEQDAPYLFNLFQLNYPRHVWKR
jgi:hypothetical protein